MVESDFQKESLNEYLWFLEDKEGTLQLSEILTPEIASRFLEPDRRLLHLGFTESTYWIKLFINNRTASPQSINVVGSYPRLDYIDFWLVDTAGNLLAHHKTGDRNPPTAVQNKHHLPILKTQAPPGRTILITRIQSHGSMAIDLNAYNDEQLHWEMASDYIIYTTLISILVVMAFYNFFIWLQLRHTAHLFYVLFVLSMVLQCFIFSGMVIFVSGWNPWLLNEGALLASGMSLIFAKIFSLHFLSLRSRHPFFYKYFLGVIAVTIAACGLVPIAYQVAAKTLVFFAAILSVNLIVVGFLSCLQKYRPAYFFLAAWFVLILTNIRRQAFFSGNPLGESYSEWEVIAGTVLEVILISLALADRVRLSEKKAYETVDNLNRNLEKIVDEQTKELRLKNESLSEQKLAVEKAHQELSDIDRAKNAFFRQVSHELRTPLTLILGSLHFFDPDASHGKETRSISRNARRLLHLVNQLLDFQKVTQSKSESAMDAIALRPLLNSICDVFQDACRKRDIVLSLIDLTKSEDSLKIRGKIDSVEKIFYNYLSNALKFTNPKTQIKIIIEDRNDKVRITVEDQGPGIDPDKLPELFQVYKRVEDKNSSMREGTGIGLALCRELALTMGGEVGVSSRLGMGSSFWVSFPRCTQEMDAHPLLDILFVHPESSIQIEFAQKVSALTEIEHLVIVGSYEEAEKSMALNRFRCVIADLKLKGIRGSGLDILRLASQLNADTIRIAIGDEESISSLQQSLDKAIVHFTMIKPIPWEVDLKKVETHLSQSPLQHELRHDLEAQRERSLIHLADLEGADEPNQANESAGHAADAARILLVDDLPEMRQLVKRMLSHLKMEILESENGLQAWQKLQEEPGIDLVITDWMMPAMSGPALISKIRSDKTLNALPIILLTAKGDDVSRQTGLQHGANAYLGKPFDKLELESSVLNLISLKQKEKDLRELNRRVTEDILKRYLPAALVQKVLNGDLMIDEAPKVKDVTIMFVDICEFTRNSEKLGPAKIGEVLNSFFDAMTRVIHQHGGTIDKFIGDAIMVIFGAPEVLPPYEQIQRAKDCALAMFKALAKINDNWQELGLPTQSMRVGFHHGPAIVGSFGGSQRSDYTVIGPTVNFAARIQSVASPNSIFVSKVVRDYLDNVSLEDMGSFEMKGLPSQNLYGLSIKVNKMAA